MRTAIGSFLLLVLAVGLANCGPERSDSDDIDSDQPLMQESVGFYQELSWAPDGSALTVSIMEPAATPEGFQYRIHLLMIDRPELAPLTTGPMDLWTSWRPDGDRIVFASRSGETSDIYVMNADGSGRASLTNDPADDTQPDWSSDGARIVFVSSRDGTEQIYVMNADGSNQRRVGAAARDAQNPAWSPDGQHIVYYETDATGNDEIYLMNADGTEKRRLVRGVWPHWTPDGSRILFGSPAGLSVVNFDGTAEALLAAGAEFGAFSPDGRRIAYITTIEGHVSINVMNADGSGSRRLLTRPAPQW